MSDAPLFERVRAEAEASDDVLRREVFRLSVGAAYVALFSALSSNERALPPVSAWFTALLRELAPDAPTTPADPLGSLARELHRISLLHARKSDPTAVEVMEGPAAAFGDFAGIVERVERYTSAVEGPNPTFSVGKLFAQAVGEPDNIAVIGHASIAFVADCKGMRELLMSYTIDLTPSPSPL